MISISISLVAAFIPLLFMSGVVGRVFREFSVTLAFAIAVSTVVSLIGDADDLRAFCAQAAEPGRDLARSRGRGVMRCMVGGYARSLGTVLSYRALTLLVMAGTIAITVDLYVGRRRAFSRRTTPV